MKKYDSYKDSGVQWIGEIPSHWEVRRFRTAMTIVRGGSPRPIEQYLSEDGYNWIKIGDTIKGTKYITSTAQKIKKEGLSSTRLVKAGDLILSNSMSFGQPYILGIEGCIHDGWLSLSPQNDIDKEFLYYTLTSDLCKNQFSSQVDGGVVQNLNIDKVKDSVLFLPNIDEQKKIVDYLDSKCSKIDNIISTQQKRIELLKELKQSVITRAVTRGINPDVKMNDSGVEWIGEVPEHWEVKKLKYLFENLDYLRQPITADQRSKENPIYDYYGASGVIDKIDFYNVDDTVLLIGEDGANLVFRNLPLIYKASGKFWVNNHAHILKPLVGVDYEYMFYTMECADYSTFITGSAQPKLSQEKINQVQYPLPPIDEQQQIVTYIEQQTSKLDSSITKALRQIELLKEYKQSLITEVVTGKRKVV